MAEQVPWEATGQGQQVEPVVRELLTQHYDPVYLQSMRRNFKQYEQAKTIAPADHSAGAMQRLAQEMLKEILEDTVPELST